MRSTARQQNRVSHSLDAYSDRNLSLDAGFTITARGMHASLPRFCVVTDEVAESDKGVQSSPGATDGSTAESRDGS